MAPWAVHPVVCQRPRRWTGVLERGLELIEETLGPVAILVNKGGTALEMIFVAD